MNEAYTRSSDSDGDIDLAAIGRILWTNKYLIVAVTILSVTIALVIAFTAPIVFRAQTSVTQVTDKGMSATTSLASQFGGLASLAGVNLGRGGPDQDAQATLASRRLVEEFIKRYNLLPELSHDDKKPLTLWKGVEKFKRSIVSIREEKRTGITTVAISWKDPVVGAQWANDFVALANELVRTRALEDSTRNIAYLNEQIGRTTVVGLQGAMYELIESETKTLMLANARTEYAFAVIDPAVPPELRISPKRTVMLVVGIVLGFAVGCCVAIAYNWFDKSRSTLAAKQP